MWSDSYVTETSLAIALTLDELQEEYKTAKTYCKVCQFFQGNKWGISDVLKPIHQIKNELIVKD